MTKHLKQIAKALEALNENLRTPTVTIQGNVGLNRPYPETTHTDTARVQAAFARATALEATIRTLNDVLYPTTNVKEAWRMLNEVQRIVDQTVKNLNLK